MCDVSTILLKVIQQRGCVDENIRERNAAWHKVMDRSSQDLANRLVQEIDEVKKAKGANLWQHAQGSVHNIVVKLCVAQKVQ